MARPDSPLAALEKALELVNGSAKDYIQSEIDKRLRESSHELKDGFAPTDRGNAARFIKLVKGKVLYVGDWKSWVIYRDGVWEVDKGAALVMKSAFKVAVGLRSLSAEPDVTKEEFSRLRKHADRCESVGAIDAMLKLARADLSVSPDVFDRKVDKLNVLNGTVDLRTGQLLPPSPEDFFTTQAPVNYDPDAKCARWMQCLEEWQPDPAVREYLQMIAGTCLTGYNVRYFFLNLGTGHNGKSKFFGTLSKLLGPYSCDIDKSLVVRTKQEQHRTVNMSLFGKRMAVTKETESGEWLAEASVKALTGDDMISGRRLYENEWQFMPTHTLFMHTNNTPPIRNNDQAIWERVRLIPWKAKFEGDQRISDLDALLQPELSGILNWMLAGAKKFMNNGHKLPEPASIKKATAAYRDDEDVLGRFFKDCFEVGPDYSCWLSDIDEAAKKWFTREDMTPWHRKNLARKLRDERGFESKVSTGGKLKFFGFQLKGDFVLIDDMDEFELEDY